MDESIELAQRVQGMSDLLLAAPGPIAAVAGICGIAVMAVGGFWARNYKH